MDPLISMSESHEMVLTEWMLMFRHNKRLHNEDSKYYKRYSGTSPLSAIILGSTVGILNIGLGAIEPSSILLINIAQICLGAVNLLASTAIIPASKHLEYEKNTLEHIEHASTYSKIHISIRLKLVLL
jgi:hypothetical protein